MRRPAVTAGELHQLLTPLERSVLVTAGRVGRDPRVIAEELEARWLEVRVPEDGLEVDRWMTLGREGPRLTVQEVRDVLRTVESKLRQLAKRNVNGSAPTASGNPVTLPRTLPPSPREEDEMEEAQTIDKPPEEPVREDGFAERMEALARAEAESVLADVAQIRPRAQRVAGVLAALGLEVPAELDALLATDGYQRMRLTFPAPEGGLAYPPGPTFPDGTTPFPGRPEPAEEPPTEPEAEEPPEEPVEPPTAAEEPPPAPPKRDTTFGAQPAPEELRGMPAVSGPGPFKSHSIDAARGQKQVYDYVRGHESSIASEVADQVDLPQARISDYLRALEGAGLIRRTGRNRHRFDRPAGMVGRASVEYAPRRGAEPKKEEPSPDVEPGTLAKVRDWVTRQKQPFSPRQVVEATAVGEDQVRAALVSLISRHCVEYVGMDDLELYEYRKPTKPGKAAEKDHERAKAAAKQNGRAGAPVAGTGAGIRVNNKDVQALIDQAIKQNWPTPELGAKHVIIRTPDGGRVIIGKTPNLSGLLKDKARLRRAGLQV